MQFIQSFIIMLIRKQSLNFCRKEFHFFLSNQPNIKKNIITVQYLIVKYITVQFSTV